MERCLCCGSSEICGCATRHTMASLKAQSSSNLAQLLRDCYTGPLAEEKNVRLAICLILWERETFQ